MTITASRLDRWWSRTRQIVFRRFAPGPPFTDELDDVIEALTIAREASLDFADQCTREGGPDAPVVRIMMPGESIDALLINLDIARRYRNHVLTYKTRWLSWQIAIATMNLTVVVVAVLKSAGWLP